MAGGNLPFGLAPSGSMTAYTPTLRERATDWLRRSLFSDDRAGQGRAEKVMDVASVTPFGFGLDVYDAGREAGLGNYGAAGVMLGMAGMPGPNPKGKPFGFTAYHGSPHDFDRFDMSKIGTGEGAQAYGHGLYFAEAEDIARSYRDALSPKKVAIGGQMVDSPTFFKAARRSPSVDDNIAMLTKQRENILKEQAQYTSDPELGDFVSELYDQQLKDVDKELAELSQYKGQWFGTRPGGHMYEVRINADPDTFLDWDKPLSEQPEAVRRALAKIDADTGSMRLSDRVGTIEAAMSGDPRLAHLLSDKNINVTGDMIHQKMFHDARKQMGGNIGAGAYQSKVAEALREAGIPGIKYLDAGSRGAGDGTRNYVVFDDKLISIIRKYGIAGASAMLGYNILDGMDPAQADELKRIEGNQ